MKKMENEIKKMLIDTLKRIEEGCHCWCKLPSGNWFCTDSDTEGLNCYINDKVDDLGYPSGNMLVYVGTINSISECENIAKFALRCDSCHC